MTAVLIIFFTKNLFGQESLKHNSIFPKGMSIEYGIGSYAITDEYISNEKYSGSLPYYGITWAKQHSDYVYHLSIDFRNSSEIKNNNVSTDIYQFTLNQGFNYALPKFTIFNKDAHLYLGPSTELFFYYNNQNIAVDGFDYAQSFALLISGGISSQLFYKLSNNFNYRRLVGFQCPLIGISNG